MNKREPADPLTEVRLPTQAEGRKRRFAAYVVGRGWLHLVLLTGVFIFCFPFLWMICTSMKTDDELTDQNWMPAVPTFKTQSPYVLGAPEIIKPIGVSEADWKTGLPNLLTATREAIVVTKPQADAVGVDAAEYRDAA